MNTMSSQHQVTTIYTTPAQLQFDQGDFIDFSTINKNPRKPLTAEQKRIPFRKQFELILRQTKPRGRKDMGRNGILDFLPSHGMGRDIYFPAISLTGWDGMGRVFNVRRDNRGTLTCDKFSAGYPKCG